MKTEEVKYVYQPDGPMLVPKTKNGAVYQETTVCNNRSPTTNAKKSGCWPGHLFSRLRLVLSCLAIVVCLIVIAVLVTSGIKASNNREEAQEEEIAKLKVLVETQQGRLHRMQKEFQFLVTRQKAYEAREESFRRRQLPIIPSSSIGTGTGSHVWPSLTDKSFVDGEEDKILSADSELPMIPRRDQSESAHQEDDVDVDKLPRASANKKRKGKMPLEEQL